MASGRGDASNMAPAEHSPQQDEPLDSIASPKESPQLARASSNPSRRRTRSDPAVQHSASDHENHEDLMQDSAAPWFHAVRDGDVQLVRSLQHLVPHVNTLDLDGWSPLAIAAFAGNLELVRYLLEECGADASMSNLDGETPLSLTLLLPGPNHVRDQIVALLSGSSGEEDKHHLDAARCDGTFSNDDVGEATVPLDVGAWLAAARAGDLNGLTSMLGQSRDYANVVDKAGWTALMHAAHCGHVQAVELLLTTSDSDPFLVNKDNDTALALARFQRHTLLCKRLNELTEALVLREWMQAARDGDMPAMRTLRPRIKSVDQLDHRGWTALMTSAHFGHIHVVQYLTRECRAQLDLKNPDGDTALRMAQLSEHLQVVSCLEACSAPRNTKQMRWTHAIIHGDLASVKQIMARADVEVSTLIDKDGWTPLMMATYAGHAHIVDFIASIPTVDLRQTNNAGESALSLAERMHHSEIASILRSRLVHSPAYQRKSFPPKKPLPRRKGRADSPIDTDSLTRLKSELARCQTETSALKLQEAEGKEQLATAHSQIVQLNERLSQAELELARLKARHLESKSDNSQSFGQRTVLVALVVLVFAALGARQALRKAPV